MNSTASDSNMTAFNRSNVIEVVIY